MKLTETGYAKINLGLDVLGLRPDKYHEVAMVMQTVSLADTVTITESPELRVTVDIPDLEGGPSNLAYKAAVLMAEYAHRKPKVHIHIDKKIFLAAGLAGGSTDAAAVLRGLNRFWELKLPTDKLERLGAKLGSDVPFCVAGGTSLATGRGEILKALPDLSGLHLVLAKPPLEISTPWAYREFDKQKNVVHPDIDGMVQAVEAGDVDGVLRRCGNVLEPVTAGAHPEIRDIQRQMLENGAEPVLMSGSGPTVFGIVREKETGEKIAATLQALHLETAVAELVGRKKV
ncbi:MAG: 4-(cytidine 5'-diphospho)-2-C-methyl-D-erythritol kinase [Acidaminococcaceae bacterium]|nr:4-(cytidine 5'-diphospho)-2-C-methyl-D-erythritol kinase [Acidaminococcaceae bacterium]